MVDGIGGSGAGRAAIEAAMKQFRARAEALGKDADTGLASASETAGTKSFEGAVKDAMRSVETQVDTTNNLHVDVLQGRLDIHEAAAQIKESEITFQFALQVRNKLLDAYREVMRMSL